MSDVIGSATAPGHGEHHCCIAGCGPAGAVLALLLARAGLDVLVLEKHGDFLRDFRGDTIHPSTLEILDELGLAERLLQLAHTKAEAITLQSAAGDTLTVDFRGLRTRFPYIAFLPQWDFLDFITDEAARYPGFHLVVNAEVIDLIEEGGVVRGVRFRTPDGEREAHALLTVGADGRTSRTREAAGLPMLETSPPMDVLWFRLSRRLDDARNVGARIGPGHFVALINRGDYWQIGYTIPKGGGAQVHAAGLEALRRSVASLVPELAGRVSELQDWDQVKLLTVRANRLTRWYKPGYLAIGDAAHAMSPVAGVGINVAIQDAVAAGNILWEPLRRGRLATQDLAAVQREREFAVRFIQAVQSFIHRRLLTPVMASTKAPSLPTALRLLLRLPGVRGALPRLVAFGVRRPRVRSPALAPCSRVGMLHKC